MAPGSPKPYCELMSIEPHVCILSLAHPPGDGRVTHKVGRGLRDAGIRVTWIGPGASVPSQTHGITFHLVPPGRGWLARLSRRGAVEKIAQGVDGVSVWMGVEPDSAALASRISSRRGGRSVFDIHEVYHDDMLRGRVPGMLRPLMGRMVQAQLRRICSRSSLSIGAGTTRLEPYLTGDARGIVVRHCLSRQYGEMPPARPFDGSRPFVRLMHGKATLSHGTREVLRSVSVARRLCNADFRIVLIKAFNPKEGFGYDEVMKIAGSLHLEGCLEWLDPMPFESMFDVMAGCDLGVIAYTRTMGVSSMPKDRKSVV